jgi:hypothetical protein
VTPSSRLNRGVPEGENNTRTISLFGVPDDPIHIPSIPLDLIQYLNLQFPDALRLVSQLGTLEAARGAREVVQHLIEVYRDQQETPHVLRRQQISSSTARPATGSTSSAATPGG